MVLDNVELRVKHDLQSLSVRLSRNRRVTLS